MFKNYSFIYLIALLSISSITAVDNELCTGEQNCSDLNNTCKCYCSVKCGPRDKKPGDTPTVVAFDNDPLGKRCFCAQRDIDLFDQCVEQEEKLADEVTGEYDESIGI